MGLPLEATLDVAVAAASIIVDAVGPSVLRVLDIDPRSWHSGLKLHSLVDQRLADAIEPMTVLWGLPGMMCRSSCGAG